MRFSEKPRKIKSLILNLIFLIIFIFSNFGICFASSKNNNSSKAEIKNQDLKEEQEDQISEKINRLSVPFVRNEGQIKNDSVLFYADLFSGRLFINDDSLTYSIMEKRQGSNPNEKWEENEPIRMYEKREIENSKKIAIKEGFVNSEGERISFDPSGQDASDIKISSFISNDKNNWRNNIASYDYLRLGNIWENIRVDLKAKKSNVEKIFTVEPNGNPSDIRIATEGVDEMSIAEDGSLVYQTGEDKVSMTAPIAYQFDINGNKISIPVEYEIIDEKTYSFQVGEYDQNLDLVIDPLLASTFLEDVSSGIHDYFHVSIASDGSVYVLAETDSADFPNPINGFSASNDMVIAKFNNDLTSLLALTYIGGTDLEGTWCAKIAFDTAGNVFISGATNSNDYPVTAGAFDETYNGGENSWYASGDFVLSKLSSDLSTLLASTYIGGTDVENQGGLVVDGSGNVYATITTYSSDFPVSGGAIPTYTAGVRNTGVFKLNNDLTTRVSSTFMSGIEGTSILLDSSDNIFISGISLGGLYTVGGGYDESFNGVYDVAIAKISNDMSQILASTYIGGSDYEDPSIYSSNALAIDSFGNIFVGGETQSSDLPNVGGYDTTYSDYKDAFIAKFNNNLSALLALTYLGGDGTEEGCEIAIDSDDNVYFLAYTDSGDLSAEYFPTTPGAYQEDEPGGAWESKNFISKFSSDLSTLVASTYLGSPEDSIGSFSSLAIDSNDNIFAFGIAGNDYPTTLGAYDTSMETTAGFFISKLDSDLSGYPMDHLEIRASEDIFEEDVESGWDPAVWTTTFSADYYGANSIVEAMAVQGDGKTVFGGSFSTYNSVSRPRIARINADGSLDTSFDPGTGASSTVYAVAIQGDGKILIGGNFTSYNGTSRGGIARLNTDGTLDTTFAPTSGINSGSVYSISIQSDGKLIIGGSFTSFNGTARNRVARVNTDGTLDGTFAPTTGANSYVNTTAIQSDGKILIGGYFSTYNGTARRGIARINADGTLDAAFTPGTGFTGGGQEVYTIKLQADEKPLVGGYFTTFNGISRVGMARLETDGTLDTTFSVGTGAYRQVEAIDIQSDGNIIIGGYLSSYNGTAINGFARVSSTGVLDGTFAGSKSGIGTLKVLADDSIVIGGYCSTDRGDYTLYGLLKTDSDGIEDDNFNVMPVTPVGWTIDNSDANSGSYSMYSATDATTYDLSLTTSYDFPTDGQVSFYWKADTDYESPVHFCVDINSTLCQDEGSGPTGYTERLLGNEDWAYVSVPVTAGTHQFEWFHVRRYPTDEAWIDDVKFTSLTDSYAIDTGVAQEIQISAINSEGDRYEYYTGDKTITFSGLSSSGINNPKCSDKNGTDVDFEDPTTLTFADGVATCNLTAVVAETASVDVTDATYDSTADTGYDLDLIVSAGAPATLSAANSIISVSPSPVEVNNLVTVTLTAYDSNGDPYTTGGDTVVFSVSGSNAATPTVTDNGDGTYTATYTPTNSGTDTITAILNGDNVGQDSDGTSDGSFVLAVSSASPGAEEEEEEEESDYLRLTKSKDNKLTFEVLISKDKKEKEEIANDDDQGTKLKEIEIKAEKKVEGDFEIKEKNNPKIENLPEYLEDQTCSIYSQIEIEADSSIENEDIDNVSLTFRVSGKYKKEHPNANFHATYKKGKKIKLLKTQKSNNKSSTETITIENSQLEGTWTILDCTENNAEPKEEVNPPAITPTPPTEEITVPTSEPETVEMDIDSDGNLEQAIDTDLNSSNGFEDFVDPDGSSELEITVDGDFDNRTDFIINTDGDSNPDTYWDPDSQTISAVEIRNVDEDPLNEYVFGIEKGKINDRYYDKTDKRVKILADSIEKPSLLDKARNLANKYHTITTGIVATAAALPLMALPFEVGSLSSAWLVVKESLLRLFGFFFWRRKKFRDWGTVYDVDSGRPIPLAIVKIIDKETGISKETKITDSLGSYYFLVSPGTYALDPEKKEFSEFTNNDLSAFPVWTEKTYQYQPLEFKEYAKVDADIPMKLVDGNFSPLPKKGFWKFMFGIIFWTGLFLNLAIFAITPGVFNALMIFVYLVLEVIRRFGKGKSKWGTVVDENGNIQSFATLKLYDALTQNLVMRTVTDEKGRYFLIANPGEYRLNVETISGKNTQMEFSLDSRSSVKFKIAV